MKFRFIWIGKTKDKNWKALQEEYLGRLSHFVKYDIVELKDSAPHETKEIEGFVINQSTTSNAKNGLETSLIKLPDTFGNLPIFPLETTKIGVNIQNALTDYDFKIENLRIFDSCFN